MTYIKHDSPLITIMRDFRRDIHAHPELAFKEIRTAEKVTSLLREMQLDSIHENLAVTGVVGVLKGQNPDSRHIGLRADMDALPMHEQNNCAHRSTYDGKMHACGHDGHTTMLLTAATWLSQNRNFEGTLYFIFQPAEENEGGAKVMVEDEKFFDQFPIQATYGMHNWPGIAAGKFAVHSGPVMAAMDTFNIHVKGTGGHGGIPNLSNDPIAASAQLITSLQTIISRNISPVESGVVSVTQITGGDSYNIIPNNVILKGTVRSFSKEVQQHIIERMEQICQGIGVSFNMDVQLNYTKCFPATINHKDNAQKCVTAAASIVGDTNVYTDLPPSMGAEDFAYFIIEKPGAYIWIGNGHQSNSLHNPEYDFNDEIIAFGANYWIELAHTA